MLIVSPSLRHRSVLGVAFALSICIAPSIVRAQDTQPILEMSPKTASSLMKPFIANCLGSAGTTDYAKLYCGCAAAVVAGSFTLADANGSQMGTLDGMEALHPGTKAKLVACANIARGSVS